MSKKDEEFERNFKIGKIDKEKEGKLRELIGKYKDICMVEGMKLGKTNIVKHKIDTGNHKPIAQKPYTANDEKRGVIKKEVEKMLEDGIIKESHSPWASP